LLEGADIGHGEMSLQKISDRTYSQLSAGSLSHPVGGEARYRLRFTADGANLTCELLDASGTVLESVEDTDSEHTSGGAGMMGGDANGALRFDNLWIGYRSGE
jgi:hypothetical protein